MNPAFKFLLAFIISLEVSIKLSLTANLAVIVFSAVYLLFSRFSWQNWLKLIFIPLIAAASLFCSLYFFSGQSSYYSWNLFTRIYVYTWAIACVSRYNTSVDFARSLEQNFHLPSKFAYGCLAALGILPQMAANIKQIRATGMMRGVYLSFWSPALYFKAITAALYSAENLAQGMESHGFVEGQKRSTIVAIPVRGRDYLLLGGLLIIFNIILFLCK
jgi:energy-coupling factor transport system permease protein